jgi:hypothetical protein
MVHIILVEQVLWVLRSAVASKSWDIGTCSDCTRLPDSEVSVWIVDRGTTSVWIVLGLSRGFDP